MRTGAGECGIYPRPARERGIEAARAHVTSAHDDQDFAIDAARPGEEGAIAATGWGGAGWRRRDEEPGDHRHGEG